MAAVRALERRGRRPVVIEDNEPCHNDTKAATERVVIWALRDSLVAGTLWTSIPSNARGLACRMVLAGLAVSICQKCRYVL